MTVLFCFPEPGRAPEFILKVKQCDVKEGQRAEFSCQVTGHPMPELTWLLNGQQLKDGGQYSLMERDQIQVCGPIPFLSAVKLLGRLYCKQLRDLITATRERPPYLMYFEPGNMFCGFIKAIAKNISLRALLRFTSNDNVGPKIYSTYR